MFNWLLHQYIERSGSSRKFFPSICEGPRSALCSDISFPFSWVMPPCLCHCSLWWWSVTSIWAWIESPLLFAKTWTLKNFLCKLHFLNSTLSCRLAFLPFGFRIIILYANSLLVVLWVIINHLHIYSCIFTKKVMLLEGSDFSIFIYILP